MPLSAAARAGAALQYRARSAGAVIHGLWLHPDRLVGTLWNGKPESVAEHFAYIKSRAWVPEELTGKKAALIAWVGFAYHILIACPVKFAAKTADAASERPLRLTGLAVFVIVLLVFI